MDLNTKVVKYCEDKNKLKKHRTMKKVIIMIEKS